MPMFQLIPTFSLSYRNAGLLWRGGCLTIWIITKELQKFATFVACRRSVCQLFKSFSWSKCTFLGGQNFRCFAEEFRCFAGKFPMFCGRIPMFCGKISDVLRKNSDVLRKNSDVLRKNFKKREPKRTRDVSLVPKKPFAFKKRLCSNLGSRLKEEKENERTEGNVSLNARYELMSVFHSFPRSPSLISSPPLRSLRLCLCHHRPIHPHHTSSQSSSVCIQPSPLIFHNLLLPTYTEL